jgi:single-stranded-DNA-specific exonuclease RecJ
MLSNQQWSLLPPAPDEYLRACGISPLVAQLLHNRGVKPDGIELFLAADRRLQGDPFLLPDMPQAVSRIYKALLSEEEIAIYGDFDVDGVTATVILAEGLSWLGGKATPYIPSRFDEGHGMRFPAIEKLHNQGTGLIITVDCGVTDLAEAKQAQEIGIDMIITDHHTPSTTLPQAIAVVDPKRKDSWYPFSELAGVGVAFKLLQALLYKHSRAKSLSELLDLVALGTVTDMVPLIGENRYLVKEGLRVLNNTRRIGLQEMMRLRRLEPGKLGTDDISWALGPCLNAAGRVDDATTSYQLLTTRSQREAHSLAMELEERNAERQNLTSEVLNRVKERLATKMHFPLLIEGDDSYHVGVIGLVAGRLAKQFYKPAIIISLGPEVCQGSTRSIPEFNVVSALEKCSDLLIGFGGHPLAAGFTVARRNLAQLEERIMRLAVSELSHLDLRPKLVIDAEVPLSTFASDAFSLIQKLSPFGQGNPQPTFLSRHVQVVECHNFGSQSEYLELKLKQENVIWRGVDFNSQKSWEEVPSYIDIVYNVEKSRWNGEEMLRLNLLDFAPS